MKVIAIVLLAFIAVAVRGAPTSITGNNIGDIVNVAVNANLTLHNHIDQNIVNVIVGLLNQQAILVAGTPTPAEAAQVSPQTLQALKKLIARN